MYMYLKKHCYIEEENVYIIYMTYIIRCWLGLPLKKIVS